MLSVLNSGFMRTKDLVAVYGTLDAVGKQFGISRSAVSQWGADVPQRRADELRGRQPDIEQRIANLRKPRREARAA